MPAPISQVSTLGSVAVLIAQAVRSYDCDPTPLFAASGIDMRQISDPNARFPTTRMQRLWRLALEATGDPCLGLTAARQFQPAALHGLGFAWLASDTLRAALTRLARYSRLINPFITIQVEDIEDRVELVLCGPEAWPDHVHAATDLGMAAFLQMCRITAGAVVNPVRVALQRPLPDCAARFEEFFAAPIEYNAVDNRLCFERQLVDKPLATAHPELARINDRTVVEYLARFDQASVTMQVRARIIERLPDGAPHQQAIARALHVSPRSLQRRLRDEATSFKTLLDETRRELAMQYIRESHRSIGEITYLLGFSQPANFTRAFKRWTGRAPIEFREAREQPV